MKNIFCKTGKLFQDFVCADEQQILLLENHCHLNVIFATINGQRLNSEFALSKKPPHRRVHRQAALVP